MKTVNVGEAPQTVGDLVEQAKTEPILLRSEGGRTFVLAEVDSADAEALSLAHNDQLRQIIERSRLRAQQEGWLTTEQVREQFGL